MDPVNRRRVVDLVRRLGREGKTVVVSSHILYEVEAMTKRVLLVHNGRILAEGDVRDIRDLLDEHPHTVALRAREPRRLAAAVVGWPSVAVGAARPAGEWLTVETDAARRVLRRAPRRGARGRASSRCTRRTRTSSRCSATWWRDEGHHAAAPVRRPRARAVFDLSLDGMVFSRRSLLMALLVAAPGRFRGPVPGARRDARHAAARPLRPLRADGRRLLGEERAAARGALLRHLARRRRGGGPDAHLPADAPDHARLDLGRQVRGLPGDHLHAGAARRRRSRSSS